MYIQLINKRILKQCFNRIPSPQGLICHFILKHSFLELVLQTNYILTHGFKIIIYINIQLYCFMFCIFVYLLSPRFQTYTMLTLTHS